MKLYIRIKEKNNIKASVYMLNYNLTFFIFGEEIRYYEMNLWSHDKTYIFDNATHINMIFWNRLK